MMKPSRSTIVCLSFGLAAMASAQNFDKRVSISIPATSIKQVLTEISKVSGEKLEAATPCADETLAVKVKDVPLGELLNRIAHVSHAEWKRSENGLRLLRAGSSLTDLAKEEAEVRGKWYQESTKALLERAASAPVFDAAKAKEAAATLNKIRTAIENGTTMPRFSGVQMPSGEKGIAAVLAGMDPRVFAMIPPGGRTVFSTSPNVMQKSLPARVMNGLRSFIEENRLYAETMKANQSSTGPQIQFGNMGSFDGDPRLGIGKVLLAATRPNSRDDIGLQLTILDPNGRTIGSSSYSLSTSRFSESKPGEPFPLSPLAAQMSKLRLSGAMAGQRIVSFTTVGSSTFSTTLSPDEQAKHANGELRRRMLQPEKFDPHAFGTNEILFGYADETKTNLVAWIPDTSFVPVNQALGTDKFALSSLPDRAASFDLTLSSKDGWTEVSGLRPSTAIHSKVNRIALGTVLRSMDSHQALPILDAIAFANAQPKAPSTQEFDGFYLNAIDNSASNTLMGLNGAPYTGLRFLAALPAGLRGRLLNGEKIALANLPTDAINMLSVDTFTSPDGPSKVNNAASDGRAFLQPGVTRTMTAMNGMIFSDGGERTELLAGGLPRFGYVQLQSQSEDGMLASDSTNMSRRVISAQQLGISQALLTSGRFPGGAMPSYTRFQPAKTTQYSMTITFIGQDMNTAFASMDRTFSDVVVDTSRGPVGYRQLPENFRKQAEESAARYQQSLSRTPRSGTIKPR